ncbi:hypothetical protein ABTY59_23520 [Streptomyces sp. NPDC096079]|uniref:hypothetical protein n=1 Tax=Streptomyces sp. NPDC096079 TaxID=3155820 RepID=UPI0033210ACE
MHSGAEPELPDPVPATPDAVTPDLPVPGPDAPDIRIDRRERPRAEEADQDGRRHEDADEVDADRPVAGPGTPAPQEQTG